MASHHLKIMEVLRVAPPSNTPESAAELSLPLTFFDLLWFKIPPVERIFFYKLTESTPAFFNLVMLPKLKQSLSLTLLHFLPLAGKVTWPPNSPKPIILYTPNDTVSLTVAESNTDFNYISSNIISDAVELHPYVPELSISDTSASVIAFQITLFPNHGFSIAYRINHAVLDGRSISMFMKSWAHICKTIEREEKADVLPELVPTFDRTVIKDPSDLGTLLLGQWAELTGPESRTNRRSLMVLPQIGDLTSTVRYTFELTREDISKLKAKVLSQMKNPFQLSTFTVTCAYASVCMVKAQQRDLNRKVMFLFSVDCRTRPELDPPIPKTYFGNCLCPRNIMGVAREFTEENGIAVIAERIGSTIRGLEMGLLNGMEGIIPRMKDAFEQGIQVISVAGSTRFDVYGNDFGWGRARKVEVPSIDRTGAISLTESRNGNGGVEIGIALPRHEMEVLAPLFVNGLNDL